MRFKGKVSWWFYAIIIGVAALLIPLMAVSAVVDPNAAAFTVDLLVFAAVELLCIPIVFYNFVELQKEALFIVFGFIRKRIPYHDISALSTTSNPMASFGASFDRIEITCKSRTSIMVSVVDKERFFNEIKKYNPDIKM